MDNFILTSLLHNKSCILPGIGTLKVITTSSERDFGNFYIKAPLQTVVLLDENGDSSPNQFSAASELIKDKVEREGHFDLTGLGTFTKTHSDQIRFVPISLPKELFQAVAAEKVIRQNVQHNILVGDKATNNFAMADYLNKEEEIIPVQKVFSEECKCYLFR
ncbi:MAG: hypothetical protein HY305_05405 [Sphingobacteriales bacterium]|nr:hypothetical protein [Sphingobacteriales bacterium]